MMTLDARSRCNICDHNCRLVSPTGPTSANILFIGEKPGENESRLGRTFCGDTGKELDKTYLPLAGLCRQDVRVINTVRCRLGDSNSKPTPTQIDTCARHHLPDDVTTCDPTLIILLGASACSLFPDIDLEKQHGIPFFYSDHSLSHYFSSWSGWIMPFYHPAAALHSTSMMIPLLDDFYRLGRWITLKWKPPTTSIPTDYTLLASPGDLDRAFDGPITYPHIPIDTESDSLTPWSLQFSLRPGHGAMILANNTSLIRDFADRISNYGLLLHNSIADLKPLESIGLATSSRPIRDTMQELYHLGNLPQSLKSAAFRLLGIKMRSWDDLTSLPSRRKLMTWLTDRWIDEGDRKIVVEVQLKTKVKYLYKPNESERALKRILSHAHKPAYDLWAKSAEAGLVGYPLQSIIYAPLDEAIQYACADADMTGRLGDWLESERARIVQEEWSIEERDKDPGIGIGMGI